jgi:hypothetical protein
MTPVSCENSGMIFWFRQHGYNLLTPFKIKILLPRKTLVILYMLSLRRHKIKQLYVLDGKEHALNQLTYADEKKLGLINVGKLVKYRNLVALQVGGENFITIKIYPNNIFCAFHADGKSVF